MPAIAYLVPYEIAVNAIDLGSGKKVVNLWHYRTGIQGAGAPAYGGAPPGPALTATFLSFFQAAYEAKILPRLNHNYKLVSYVMRSIVGKRYGTPINPIAAMTVGTPISISTVVPHGLSSGNVVAVAGVTTPAAANGVYTISVTTPSSFLILGTTAVAPWSGDGTWQKASGQVQYAYGSSDSIVSTAVGGIAGDSLPLYCTFSMRKFNSGVGRNFRSRTSFSPISESDSVDGGLVGGSITAINAACVFMVGGALMANGGTDPGSGYMNLLAVSKTIALAQPAPFVTSDPWTRQVTLMTVQPNTGSLVRRKPRLTSPIT